MIAGLFLALLIVTASIALLSVRVIVKKNGTFHAEDVGESSAMRKRGINCYISQDKEERMKAERMKRKTTTHATPNTH